MKTARSRKNQKSRLSVRSPKAGGPTIAWWWGGLKKGKIVILGKKHGEKFCHE